MTSIDLTGPYMKRPIGFMGLWRFDDWRMKVYAIGQALPDSHRGLVEAARAQAGSLLLEKGNATNNYRVGFIGIHQGKTANFVFVDWWADENELHHHVLVSTLERPAELVDRTGSGLAACVWDLAVICYERSAWLDTVLANPSGPDVERYLDRQLSADI